MFSAFRDKAASFVGFSSTDERNMHIQDMQAQLDDLENAMKSIKVDMSVITAARRDLDDMQITTSSAFNAGFDDQTFN